MKQILPIVIATFISTAFAAEETLPDPQFKLRFDAAVDLTSRAILDSDTTIVLLANRLDAFHRRSRLPDGSTPALSYLGAGPFFRAATIRSATQLPEMVYVRENDFIEFRGRLDGKEPPDYVPALAVGDSVWLAFLKPVETWPVAKHLDQEATTKWLAEQDGKIPVHDAIKQLGWESILNRNTWFEPYDKLALFWVDLPVPEMPALKVHPLNEESTRRMFEAAKRMMRPREGYGYVKFSAAFVDDMRTLLTDLGLETMHSKPDLRKLLSVEPTELLQKLKSEEAKQVLWRIRERVLNPIPAPASSPHAGESPY